MRVTRADPYSYAPLAARPQGRSPYRRSWPSPRVVDTASNSPGDRDELRRILWAHARSKDKNTTIRAATELERIEEKTATLNGEGAQY